MSETRARFRRALAACVLATIPGLARADGYALQPGDVLELYVAGPADIRESMPVNIDGEIVVPLAGVLPAAGRTLNQVSDDIRERVAMTALPALDDNGLSTAEHIHPSLVSVTLRGYRPVYVDGAVRHPGAHDFIPGLTVHQAIALAGGTSPDDGAETSALRRIELEGRLGDLRVRALAAQAKVDRLRAEIEDTAAPNKGGTTSAEALERLTGALRQQRIGTDLAYYDAARGSAATELDALRRQLTAESDGVAADTREFDRLAEAQMAGTVTSARLGEARRGLLFAQSGQWETQARLASLERDDGMLANQRAQRLLQAREEAAEALGAELLTLNGIKAEVAAAGRALAYLSDASDRAGAEPPVIEVTRAGQPIPVAADEDPPLRPGDLVHVTLPEPAG